jgi:hypothetical protein
MDNGPFPDLYADSLSVASSPYGWALTFLLTNPPLEGEEATARVVARIRVSPELIRAMAEALAAGQSEAPASQPGT